MPLYPPSSLDASQVLQHAFDDTLQALRTTATATVITPPQLQVVITHDEDSIRLGDGTNLTTISNVNSKYGLDVNVLNSLNANFSGLSTDLKSSRVTVTDIPTKVPATALTNRNSISIRILGTNIVYFGDSSVTTSNGYPKFQYEEIIADVKDNSSVEIWAVCDSGKSCEVAILELA